MAKKNQKEVELEQAIERLIFLLGSGKKGMNMILIDLDYKAIETVLKEIQKYKNMYEAEHRIHEVRNRQLRDTSRNLSKYQEEYRKQKAIINEMAEQLEGEAIFEITGYVILKNKDEVIEYFKKRVEDEN